MPVEFEGFSFDASTYELRRGGDEIALEPQVLEVLAQLVANRDRVVTKEELLDEVWGSRYVSESALTSRIKTARKALGDDGRAQRIIKTVHGRGYRFVAPVTVEPEPARAPADHAAGAGPPPGSGLPAERTPLVGRTHDLADVSSALVDHRLVTLLGMGGSGKTRLAVAVGREALECFAAGVWFVDLVSASDERAVDLAIAAAADLAIVDPDGVRAQVARLIVDRDVLVILDNAEHVAGEVAAVLDVLLETTHGPRFLVTSRLPLGLVDEHRVAVGPLASGSADAPGPAVELLVASAARFGTTLEPDQEVLRQICDRLDGLPLAIELAAAQLRHLAPAALSERLDRRFEVLAGRARPGRDRHASLHAVLDDTVATLDDDERTLLEELSVFPAPCTLDDLGGIARSARPGAVERTLGQLVDHSLVVCDLGGDGRYRLLETVKLFVRGRCDGDRLAELDDRHAAWCLEEVGDDPRRHLFAFDLADWCSSHHEDLRTATNHLDREGRHVEAATLSAACGLAMHSDLGARASAMLGRVREQLAVVERDELLAQLHMTAVLCGMATRAPQVIAHHGELARVHAECSGVVFLRSAAAVLASWSVVFVDPEAAIEFTAEAAALAAAHEEPAARDFADGYRCFHLALRRRYEEAASLADTVIARDPGRTSGYPVHVAIAASAALRFLDAPAEIGGWADQGLLTPGVHHRMWANDLLRATVHAANGDHRRASAIARSVAARLEQAGQDPFPDLLLPPAALAHHRGDEARAAGWLRCVRGAGRPTQSFQATIIYRRLHDAVGSAVDDPAADDADLLGRPLGEVGSEALRWMAEPTR